MEEDLPKQDITIYHKNEDKTYTGYIVEASVRHTSIINHNRTGTNSVDSAVIRIFDIKGFNKDYFVSKDDVIVTSAVKDKIISTTPQTQLSEKYGKDNVLKVRAIDLHKFNDEDIEELNHIKLGCI